VIFVVSLILLLRLIWGICRLGNIHVRRRGRRIVVVVE